MREHKAVMAAVVTASLLMLASGLTHRRLAATLCVPTGARPIEPATLAPFPLQIGDWRGRDVPLEERILRKTGTDAHLNRRYSRRDGLESVSLYVACGVRVEEVMGHYPEVCYGGAGRLLKKRDSLEIPLDDGTKIPCNVFQFFRGGLDAEKAVVLHYCRVDGKYYQTMSQLWSHAWRRFAAKRYAAQVQIVATEALNQEAGVRLVSSFALDSAPFLARLFADIETIQNVVSPGESPAAEKSR
jgi:EpsI family protein